MDIIPGIEVLAGKKLIGKGTIMSLADGVIGIINLSEMVKQGIFRGIKDEVLFSKVYTTGYSIAWSDELEIDTLTIYAELLCRQPEEVPSYSNL